MPSQKITFALFFGNRGFFPASLIAEAREQLPRVLKALGHETLMLDAAATPHGAIESPRDGEVYAHFLRQNRGKFGGVILSLPNFGDETGAVSALKEAGVPILVQAYPDDLIKMSPALRRDSFCGKLSVMDVFCQYGLPFPVLKPHVVHPESPEFAANVDHFDRVCRVVGGMRECTVGAIGARTTPFKTVRIDELALQKHGVTVETVDLSSVIAQVRALPAGDKAVQDKVSMLRGFADWRNVPAAALENLARLAVVLDRLIEEMQLDALAIRCWAELQLELGVSPCVLLGALNDRGVGAACEVDLGNAVVLRALGLASGEPAALLDWNNNYGSDEDKCILFHCGPVPPSLMTGPGCVVDHAILGTTIGEGRSWGCNVGRIKPTPFTFGSMMTLDGRLKFFLGEGAITSDPIPQDFFGCAGVAQIDRLQDVLLYMGRTGHRHHVSITPGRHLAPAREAFERYLGYDVAVPQNG
ncbi:MAG: hypothetical protein M1457_07090 [bacterium]|nr:hypothetical protein [bacterium]